VCILVMFGCLYFFCIGFGVGAIVMISANMMFLHICLLYFGIVWLI
jgi:hypothetical protein